MLPSLCFILSALTWSDRCPDRTPTLFTHEALAIPDIPLGKAKRDIGLSTGVSLQACPTIPTTTSPPLILTVVTPSPGASPVEVTEQSQVVTSFVPQFTFCVGPAIGLSAFTIPGPPYTNYSTIQAGTGSCSTVYTPSPTTLCATVLTGIASKLTVSQCNETITFSSQYGYRLTSSPITLSASGSVTTQPVIETLTTFYAAPWQQLTSAGSPPRDVSVKVCSTLNDGRLECIEIQEVWRVEMVTLTSTITSDVDLTTTISGPGSLYIATIHENITTTFTTYSLSTTLAVEIEIETETTKKVSSVDWPRKTPTSTKPWTLPALETVEPIETFETIQTFVPLFTGWSNSTKSTSTRTATITEYTTRTLHRVTSFGTSLATGFGTNSSSFRTIT